MGPGHYNKMSSYAASVDVIYFHGLPRAGGGNEFQLPPTSLLESARTDPYYRGTSSPGVGLIAAGVLAAFLLLVFQCNLYCYRKRCCCCSRWPLLYQRLLMSAAAVVSGALSFALLAVFSRLSAALGDVQTSLQMLVTALGSLADQGVQLNKVLGSVQSAGAAIAAVTANVTCEPVPPIPCIVNPFIPCLPNPYQVCLDAVSELIPHAASASEAASAGTTLVTFAISAFNSCVGLITRALASVPWDELRARITLAGNTLVGLTVCICALQFLFGWCTSKGPCMRRLFGCSGLLGLILQCLLFVLAGFLYTGGLLSADFCIAPLPTVYRLAIASPSVGASSEVLNTLAFILSCAGAIPPSSASNSTGALGTVQGGASLLSSASTFPSAYSTLPSVVTPLLPAPAGSLISALGSGNSGFAALADALACSRINALLDPVQLSVCSFSAGAIIVLSKLLIAGALFIFLQQVSAFWIAESSTALANLVSADPTAGATAKGEAHQPKVIGATWHANSVHIVNSPLHKLPAGSSPSYSSGV
jgi:hypothetical protein